jgi:hypothetical protein
MSGKEVRETLGFLGVVAYQEIGIATAAYHQSFAYAWKARHHKELLLFRVGFKGSSLARVRGAAAEFRDVRPQHSADVVGSAGPARWRNYVRPGKMRLDLERQGSRGSGERCPRRRAARSANPTWLAPPS